MNTIEVVKVAVFLTYNYSLKTWDESGTLSRELKVYKHISKNYGVDFIFITYGDEEDLNYGEFLGNFKVIPLYTHIKKHKSKILNYINSFFAPYRLKDYLKEVDVLHQHQLLGSWVPILYRKIHKIPLVIRTGYDMYEFSKKENKNIFISYMYKILTIISIKLSDSYTVTSHSDYDLIRKFQRHSNHIKYIPNWIEPEDIVSLKDRFEKRVLCVGRLVHQKNFDYIIKEFKQLSKEVFIDIVGSGPEDENLKKIAEENNVRLTLIPNLNHSELMNLYKKYKYFISSSTFEGNPKTILEAMSSGCIVLASNIPNHKEIIVSEFKKDKVCGFLFDLQPTNLLNLFQELINQDEKLTEISNNARESVNQLNSLENIGLLTYKDYVNLKS